MTERNSKKRIAARVAALCMVCLLGGRGRTVAASSVPASEETAYGSGLAEATQVETYGSGLAESAQEETYGSGLAEGAAETDETLGSGQAAGSGQAIGSGAGESEEAWTPFGDEAAVTSAARGENGYYNTGLPILSITLPAGVNIATINTGSKSIKYKHTVVELLGADGTAESYYNNVTFKGHGNSTWMNDRKKPYQLKFKNKVDLLGLGASRRWLLLSNSFDPSMLRNEFTFRIAQYMDMPGANAGTFADVYVDGTYLGCYYVCHKTEIGTATLNLKDENGILCEWDEIHPAGEEDAYFEAPMSGKRILRIGTVHEENEDEAWNAFQEAFSALESAVWNGDWETASSLMDVHSFAQYYVIEEFAKNEDAGGSSFYMYKDGDGDVIHAGPVWDMDLAYGNAIYSAQEHPEYNSVEGEHAFNQNDYAIITRMLAFDEFREEIARVYIEEYQPAYEKALADLEASRQQIALSAQIDHEYWNRVSFADGYAYFEAWITMRVPYAEQVFLGAEPAAGEPVIEDHRELISVCVYGVLFAISLLAFAGWQHYRRAAKRN